MKEKIFVIDDDADTRELINTILQNNGYDVIEANNGEHAIELIENGEIEPNELTAIFLDILMPGMSGLDVLVRLKTQVATQNVPVITLTTQDMADDFIVGYELGTEYYIPKPFTSEQLIFGLNLVRGTDA